MKLYSPFLCLLSLLLFSCTEKRNTDSEHSYKDSINIYYKKASENYMPTEKLSFNIKAWQLAKIMKNDTISFRVIAQRRDIMEVTFPDSVPYYIEQLDKIANSTKWKKHLAYAAGRKADYYYSHQKSDSAYIYYVNSKENYLEEKDSVSAGYSLLRMGQIELLHGDYNATQSNVTEALTFFKNAPDYPFINDYRREAYNTIGISYINLQDYESALSYYEHAKTFTKDAFSKAVIDNNIGLVYLQREDYAMAIPQFKTVSKAKAIANDPLEKAMALDNLGIALYRKDGKSGLSEMLEALKIRLQNGIDTAVPRSYLHLAAYYSNWDPKLAMDYAKKAEQAATKANIVEGRLEALEQLIRLHPPTESKSLSELFLSIRDSVDTKRKADNNAFAKAKYDVRAKDELIFQNELKSQRDTLLYIIIIGGMFLLGGIFFYWLRGRYKKEKRREAYNTEIRLSKKIHDELANDVYHTMAFAEMQDLSFSENKETLLNNLDNIYLRTRNISKENDTVATEAGFADQLRSMISGYKNQQISIAVVGFDEMEWHTMNGDIKIALYRTIQELMTNMKKHSKCERAVLTFRHLKNSIAVNYKDDGIGLPRDKEIPKSGLQNMENRIHAINGNVTFENASEKGCQIRFTLPLH